MSPFERVQEQRQRGQRDFRDWKKHHVRINGWLPIFKDCKAHYGSIRYLTLCAKEAIDVRYFAQKGLLERNQEGNDYPSITLIEAKVEDDAFIAESLGKVRLGIHGTLEDALLNKSNPYYTELQGSFPYHVVNLDFCGHIVPPRDHPYSETIRCINRVIELQSDSDIDHWYLFLTFRAQQEHSNQEANAQLEDIVVQNLLRPEFKTSYGKRAAPSDLKKKFYPEFLRIGIGKLIADRTRARNLKVSVRSSWLYGRSSREYHIVKLILRFDRLQHHTHLPNPHNATAAYEEAIHNLFKSGATNVDGLGRAARQNALTDLDAVISELEKSGIIS